MGFTPDPWAWTDWKYATDDGRFNGRWDDLHGQFRTAYVGNSLFACLIEVFAKYRRDEALSLDLVDIVEDPVDGEEFPSPPASAIGYDWLELRLTASAVLTGSFCDINASATVAALWSRFANMALRFGAKDFDLAALKDSGPRNLTRAVASSLYAQTDPVLDGIEFTSRHGDDLKLWAIFERPSAEMDSSPLLANCETRPLTPDTRQLLDAFNTFGLLGELTPPQKHLPGGAGSGNWRVSSSRRSTLQPGQSSSGMG